MALLSKFREGLDWYKSRTPAIKAVITVCLTYLLNIAIYQTARWVMADRASAAMAPYNNSNTEIGKFIKNTAIPVLGNETYTRAFRLQEEIISQRRSHHYDVSMMFLKNYYAINFCLILISCVGGLLLFVLINKGWSDSSFTLKTIFLSLASLAMLLTLISNVFSHQKNFENNMVRYMDYTKAELKMAQQVSELSKKDFPTLKKEVTSGDSTMVTDSMKYFKHLDTLVAHNNSIIHGLTNYILSIDASKLKGMNEIYQSLLELKNTVRTDTTSR